MHKEKLQLRAGSYRPFVAHAVPLNEGGITLQHTETAF